MNWPFRHYHKPALIVFSLIGALLLTFLPDGQTGLSLRTPPAEGAVDSAESRENLQDFRLRILSRVIMLVHERYIEPGRIDQRAMLLGGLDYIQRTVAEVQLRHREGDDDLTVQVNSEERSFSLNDLDRPWALTFRFREVFRFIRAHLADEDVTMEDIEYAACNGLLHTLDPHSVLLVPELYEEMRLGTRGEFGGLGIVISIRDGQLTIISPIDGTPAARAGLRRMDRIAMIGEETTINMTLEEAVDRLRGPPGTQVSIRVTRRGWTEPRLFEITRAVIRIESVESEMLPNSVGYVKIRNFQGNTHDDLIEHLSRLRHQGMQTLILDLRDDPGGLLDQAVRVANTFLPEGVIVTTAGNDLAEREVRQAGSENTEPDYPMVVLVNSGSASASEIVAGALKYNNRALIVGERTFGKGSVQVLYDFDDGSALKLTIAHYLAPGDISIQSVGIVPDIEVVTLVVGRRRVDLIPDESSLRESSLESHLAGQSETPQERPAHRIRHYRVPEPEEENERNRREQSEEERRPTGEDRTQPDSLNPANSPQGEDEPNPEGNQEASQTLGVDDNENKNHLEDFEIRLAHDLLRRADSSNRITLIEGAGSLIASRQEAEDTRMVSGFQRLEVNWTEGRDQGPTELDIEVMAHELDGAGRLNEVVAGERLELTVSATNRGQFPVHRLHAKTQSDNPYFDDQELPIGRVNPGETKSWTLKLRVPRDSHSRSDPIKVSFSELHGHAPPDQEITVAVRGLERPTFSYAFQIVDSEHGNGDGRLSRGERVQLFVTIANQGPGRTYSTQINIKNESGEGVLIHDGRSVLGELQNGDTRNHAFEFEVLPSFEENEVELELAITDFELREEVTESLEFALVDALETLEPASGHMLSLSRTPVYECADTEAHLVGWIPAEGVYSINGRIGSFLRLQLANGRTGWVQQEYLEQTTRVDDEPTEPPFEVRMDNTPPEIILTTPPPLIVSGENLLLDGVVADADRVLDMYIFVGRRKVFYLSNRDGDDPRNLSFTAHLPLEVGSNFVVIVARETGDIVARQIMIVRRDGPPQQARGQE